MLICGIDEAGRGPFVGPLTAAAVILPEGFNTSDLNDSKKLSEAKREMLFSIITTGCFHSIAWVWPEEIDRLNIHKATLLAMKRAYNGLTVKADKVLVDGKFAPDLDVATETIIKGDSKEPAIMAASILAKVSRDQFMKRYSWIEKEYGFEQHKGYPTKAHKEAYFLHGPSGMHRYSYRIKKKS